MRRMRVYVEFFYPNGFAACGSDGVSVLDGRLGLFRLEIAAEEAARGWKALHPSRKLGGWRVRRGRRFDDRNPILAERVYALDDCSINGGAR